MPQDKNWDGWSPETYALWRHLWSTRRQALDDVRRLTIANERLRARVDRLEVELVRCRERAR